MATKVVPFADPRTAAARVIVGVVARSTHDRRGLEDAWVSMIMGSDSHILTVEFKTEHYGDEAWARAVTYGKGLAERLGVEFRKKRGLISEAARRA